MLDIYNRRYLGNKRYLASEIYKISNQHFPKTDYVFADLFAGSGAVASHFILNNKRVVINDLLHSNYVTYKAWFGKGRFRKKTVSKIIDSFNAINPDDLKDNYFSNIYGGKYFTIANAKKIGYIRDCIAEENLKERERYILISSLMYAADKCANTVGHFEHYLSSNVNNKKLFMEKLNVYDTTSAKIYKQDANLLSKKISSDVVYIDPPYNARQYVNLYHVLENLANWDKPDEFQGKSMKFIRNHLKSDYCKVNAAKTMQDLIDSINSKIIILSYNNTTTARSTSSNIKISLEEIKSILSSKGKITKVKEIPYKPFSAGKTNFENHQELLFVCKVS